MFGGSNRNFSASEQRLYQLTDDNAFVDVGAILGGSGPRRGGVGGAGGGGTGGGSAAGAKGSLSSRRSHAVGSGGGGRGAQTVVQNANDDEFFDRDEMLQSGKVRQRGVDADGKQSGKRKREDGERERGAGEAQSGGALASNPFFRGRINLNAALSEQHRLFEVALRQRRRRGHKKSHRRGGHGNRGENMDEENKRSRGSSSSNSSTRSSSSEDSDIGRISDDDLFFTEQMSGTEGSMVQVNHKGMPGTSSSALGMGEDENAMIDEGDLRETCTTLDNGWNAFQQWRSLQRNHADVHLTRVRQIVEFAEVEWMHHSFASWHSTVAAPGKQTQTTANAATTLRGGKAAQGQSHSKSVRVDREASEPTVRGEKPSDNSVPSSNADPPALLPLPKSSIFFRDDGQQLSCKNSGTQMRSGKENMHQGMKTQTAIGTGGFHLCSVCQLPAQYRCTRCLRDLFCSIECHVVHEATRCLKFIQ